MNKNNFFSFFTGGITSTIPHNTVTVEQIYKAIKSPNAYKKDISNLTPESKKDLDYVTFGGVFEKRNNKDLIHGSGLISIDLDDLENIEESKEILKANHHTHLLFKSPSGKGLKLVIKIPVVSSNSEYRQYFEHFISTLNSKVDYLPDISRACFMSYDADAYYNPNSVIYNDKIESESSINTLMEVSSELIDLIIPYWKSGNRQHLSLYLTAILRQEGYGTKTVENVIKTIMKKTGDTDINERMTTVKTTFALNNDEIKGYSGIKKIVEESDYLKFERIIKTRIKVKKNLMAKGKNFDQLMNGKYEPLSWRIPEIIMDGGSLTIIAGEGGKFKTFLTMFMIRALLTGNSFLQHDNIKKCKVMLIDEESGERRIHLRLNKIMKHCKDDVNPDDFKSFSFTNDFIFNDVGMAQLESVIEEFKPEVIFMDSLTRLFMGKENSADETKVIFNYLKNLKEKYNCCFVIVHHFNKGNEAGMRLRGSSELVSAPDVIINLQEIKPNFYKYYHDKLRDGVKGKEFRFEVKDIGEELDIEYLGEQEVHTKVSAYDKHMKAVEDYIFENDLYGKDIKTSDLRDEAGLAKNTYMSVLKDLESAGKLRILKQGTIHIEKNIENIEEVDKL